MDDYFENLFLSETKLLSVTEKCLFLKNKVSRLRGMIEDPICCEICTGIDKFLLKKYTEKQFEVSREL